MSGATVSVILAVRNGERYLASALERIVSQSQPATEILVIDGHSTDRTAEVAQSFAQVRYIQQSGEGISDAWNTGIAQARGDLLSFASHDDLWDRDKLALQTGPLLTDAAPGYTVCRIRYAVDPGQPLPPGFRPEWLESDPVAFIMETLVARRSLFATVGCFDPSLRIAEDIDWFARAREAGIGYSVIDRVLLVKQMHDTNTSLQHGDESLLQALRNSIHRKRRGTSTA